MLMRTSCAGAGSFFQRRSLLSGTITTSHLVMRPFTDADAPFVLSVFSDSQMNRFLPWFPIQTLEEAQAFLRRPWLEENLKSYWIFRKEDTSSPIGYIGLADGEAHDLGYGLLPDWWHQGLMSEAALAFVDFLRKEGLDFITATHDVLNVASGRVMERIGMSLRCSYVEHWMPKDYDVTFRMYQLDFKEGVETWKGYLH